MIYCAPPLGCLAYAGDISLVLHAHHSHVLAAVLAYPDKRYATHSTTLFQASQLQHVTLMQITDPTLTVYILIWLNPGPLNSCTRQLQAELPTI